MVALFVIKSNNNFEPVGILSSNLVSNNFYGFVLIGIPLSILAANEDISPPSADLTNILPW